MDFRIVSQPDFPDAAGAMKISPLLSLAAICLLTGCAHNVSYKLSATDKWQAAPIPRTLRVSTFQDRTTAETNGEVRINNVRYRTNKRDRYKNHEIAENVTAMVTKHLAYSGLFKEVKSGSKDPVDLELSGAIGEYRSLATINVAAEAGQLASAFGGVAGVLIGMAATSGSKSDVQASVKLDDLKLRDTRSGETLWQDNIVVATNFSAHFSASDPGNIHQHADSALKLAVDELIHKLATTFQTNGVSPKP